MKLLNIRAMLTLGFLCCFLSLFPNQVNSAEPAQRSLQFAGQWPYHSSKAIAMDVQRQLIYLGDGDTVNILDSDLNFISSFKAIASSQIGGLFFSAIDNLLYIACNTEGLKIYDITDPVNPLLLNTYPPDFLETVGVFIDGSKAYLSSGIDGMIILDISDINNPFILSQSRLPGGFGISYAIDIYASGNYAFVADLYNGLHIVDVANPKEPDYKKGIALAGATDISVSGDYLYLTLQSSGMSILDISSPEDTSVASLFLGDDVATSVRVDDNFSFISFAFTGIQGLDTSDKTAPVHNQDLIYQDSGGSSLGLFPDSDSIFFANDQSGLEKIDITDKSNMQAVASHDTPADSISIDVYGNYIYSVDNTVGDEPDKEGLRIHQITASNKVVLFSYTGFCQTPGNATDIMVDNAYAYIADGQEGLQILDISDKNHPEITGTYDTAGYASGVFIDGNHAYVADGDQGISIIDISEKTSPNLVGSLDISGFARKVFVSGDYAYVAADKQGIVIINIVNKSEPEISGVYDTIGTANGISVNNNYAFVADGEKGISIINIIDKTNPILAGTLDTDGFAENVSISDNYVYVADGKNGLCIIDASIPSQPVPVKEWSYNSSGVSTDVYSGYFTEEEEIYGFIAAGAAGVIAVNLTIGNIDSDGESGGNTGSGCFVETIKR